MNADEDRLREQRGNCEQDEEATEETEITKATRALRRQVLITKTRKRESLGNEGRVNRRDYE